MKKRLSEILETIKTIAPEKDCMADGLILDSRQVTEGKVFCAYQGMIVDGNQYIPDAFEKGAVAVITDNQESLIQYATLKKPIIFIPDLKYKISLLAANFFEHPSKKLKVIGITGTNGKTSMCHFLAQALSELGKRTAVIGTLGNGPFGQQSHSHLTTPDPIEIQELMADFVESGIEFVIMEASSHGIVQRRVEAVQFETAIFTNLTRDHLDFHGNMAAYGQAKRRLFEFSSLKQIVLNQDDEFGESLISELSPKQNTFVYSTQAIEKFASLPFIHSCHANIGLSGITASVQSPWGSGVVHANLLGNFNLSNVLACVTVLGIYGFSFEEIVKSLSKIKPINGRMQLFSVDQSPNVVVDFAHTPDALKQTLRTLRNYTDGDLWCVFGCGGNRDQGKRALMGQIAELFADKIVLTDDNPRDENPSDILADILSGVSEPEKVIIEHDRRRAIAHCINSADKADVILVAGKGHETYQIYGSEKLPFSDELEVQMLLMEK